MGSVGEGVFIPFIAFSIRRNDRSGVTFHHNTNTLGDDDREEIVKSN